MSDGTVDTTPEKIAFLGPDEFVRLKESPIEHLPPSDTLKFSVQIPVYNEMPVDVWEFREHPKLALSLRSLASAALVYKKEGKSVTDIEILCNINNSANERREGNMRAIELIHSFWDSRPIDEVMSKFDWIPSSYNIAEFDEPEQNRMVSLRNFYSTLIADMRTLISDGMQIHPIDCTDGGVVSDIKGQEISYQKTQGSRRWLMSEIAEHRFDISTSDSTNKHIDDSQYMIPLDADSMVSPLFFLDLSSQTENNHSAAVFILPYEFVKDTGWFISRIMEMKDASGKPFIDTFTDKQIGDAILELSFMNPKHLSNVRDFFRLQGFSDEQINFFDSINPHDYLGLTGYVSAYTDIYAKIKDFL